MDGNLRTKGVESKAEMILVEIVAERREPICEDIRQARLSPPLNSGHNEFCRPCVNRVSNAGQDEIPDVPNSTRVIVADKGQPWHEFSFIAKPAQWPPHVIPIE